MSALRDRSAWILATSLLILTFLFRGLLYLSILPPFEGWDEYQHLAYIAYVAENRSIPVLGQSHVPPSLRPLLASFPHPANSREQTRAWGTSGYATFWTNPVPVPGSDPPAPISLYEAQHPPLYYWLMAPLWRALGPAHPLGAISTLRLVNLLFAAAGLGIFAFTLRCLIASFVPRLVVLGLVCLHPLFLQNAARVANDSLAIACGMAAVACLAAAGDSPRAGENCPQRRWREAGTAGFAWFMLSAVFVALGAWAKQTGLIFVPVLLVAPVLFARSHRMLPRQAAFAGAAGLLAFVTLMTPLWLFNLHHYDSVTVTQEALTLKSHGATWLGLIHTLPSLQWRRFIGLVFPGFPWVGGWSIVPIDRDLNHIYLWITRLFWFSAAAGAAIRLVSWWRARKVPGTRAAGQPFASGISRLCGAIVAATVAAMLYHAVVSHALFGFLTTNPWYFMGALPFLFVLLVQGTYAADRRLPLVFGLALSALFVVIELHGLFFDLAPFYANAADPPLIWQRLGTLHPSFLHPAQRGVYLALEWTALAGVIVTSLRSVRHTPDGR